MLSYAVHFCRPGPGVLPLPPALLERQAAQVPARDALATKADLLASTTQENRSE